MNIRKTLKDTALIVLMIACFTGLAHMAIESLPPAACEKTNSCGD